MSSASRSPRAGHAARVTRRPAAFTLIELLVVISIIGVLAALSVPALKNLGKSNLTVGASRQMLDDFARARQLAMSHHTTVYMVFVKTNFWMATGINSFPNPNPWWQKLTPAQKTSATNLCDKQLTGYSFISLRSVGDQPGRGAARYLAPWHNLPDGTFIASQKFQASNSVPFYIAAYDPYLPIYGFSAAPNIPFPTEDSPPSSVLSLPYVAFNYLGQLTFDGQTPADRDEYIPLAQGSVSPAIDATTKALILAAPPGGAASFAENPPGNSTNSTYNIIHIDHLTGRATLDYRRVQ